MAAACAVRDGRARTVSSAAGRSGERSLSISLFLGSAVTGRVTAGRDLVSREIFPAHLFFFLIYLLYFSVYIVRPSLSRDTNVRPENDVRVYAGMTCPRTVRM